MERLSIFSGGFTLEAAQTVCTDETIHNAEVPRLLARLVERSLVERCRLADAERYRVPEPLRSAAGEGLTARGQAGKFRLRLVDHLLALARQGDGCLTQGGEGAYGWEWGVPVGAEGTAWLNLSWLLGSSVVIFVRMSQVASAWLTMCQTRVRAAERAQTRSGFGCARPWVWSQR